MEVDAFDAGFARVGPPTGALPAPRDSDSLRRESEETIHLVHDDEVWRWQDDSSTQVCCSEGCGGSFWLLNRKHHCRPCGRIFCKECSDVDADGVRWCKECRAVRETQDEAMTAMSSRAGRARKMRNLVGKAKMERARRTDAVPLAALTSDGPPKKIFRITEWLGADDGLAPHAYKTCLARDDRVGDVVRIKMVPHGGFDPRSRSGSVSPQAADPASKTRVVQDMLHQAPSPTADYLENQNAAWAGVPVAAPPLSSFDEALAHSLVMCEKVVTYCDETEGLDGLPATDLPVRRVYDIFAQPKGFLTPSVLWVVAEHLAGSRVLSEVLARQYPPLVLAQAPRAKTRPAAPVPRINPYGSWGAEPATASPIMQEEEVMEEMIDHAAQYNASFERVECMYDSVQRGRVAPRDDARRMSRGIGDEAIVANITGLLLKAVATVHAAGVVHRAITPACVLITGSVGVEDASGATRAGGRRASAPPSSQARGRQRPPTPPLRVHLEDFSAAMKYSAAASADAPGATPSYACASPFSPFPDPSGRAAVSDARVVGAVGYTAPEVWDRSYTPQTDVWNIGCVVVELATGHSPCAWVATHLRDVIADVTSRGVGAAAARDPTPDPPLSPTAPVAEALADLDPLDYAEVCRRMRDALVNHRIRLDPKPRLSLDAATDPWSDDLLDFLDLCFRPADERPSCRELLQHGFVTRLNGAGDAVRRRAGTHLEAQDLYSIMGTRLQAPVVRVR